MLLDGTKIRMLLTFGVVQNSNLENINATSLDVTLGDSILVERPSGLRGRVRLGEGKLETYTVKIPEEGYVLSPGEFILAHTQEVFCLPDDISAEYKLKSSMARIGLEHLNAGWCDAGWNGSVLTLELKNMTRMHEIVLKTGDKIGQMVFFRHQPAGEFSYRIKGRYNGDKTVTSAKPLAPEEPKIVKKGTEEGDTCNRNGCDGEMVLPDVEGCSCHINPQCSACTNNKVVCQACGATEEDDYE